MEKRTRNYIKIATIFFFFSAASGLYNGFLYLVNPSMLNQYTAVFAELGISFNIEALVTFSAIYSFAMSACSLTCGIYYLIIQSKWSQEKFEAKRKSYIVFAIILGILFGGLLCMFFLLYPALSKPQTTENKLDEISKTEEKYHIESVSNEIKKIKELREKGMITQEEYVVMLEKLIK